MHLGASIVVPVATEKKISEQISVRFSLSIGQLIGNSVCPPVLGMVLSEAMYSAGLTSTRLAWQP